MREFNSKALETLTFDAVRKKLESGSGNGIVFEQSVFMPEADVLCCRHQGKRFNIKFDLDYGVSLQPIDAFSEHDIETIIAHLLESESSERPYR